MSILPSLTLTLGGILATCAMLLTIPVEYAGVSWASLSAGLLNCLFVICFFPWLNNSRRAFVVIALALAVIAVFTLPNWQATLQSGLQRMSFIAAFFTATATIRSVATHSDSVTKCGDFLAKQAPGRRYLALTVGGHLFGLILSYGAITLLGAATTASTIKEQDSNMQRHRTRRMLVAIQRGFVSALTWSPLGFAMAISLLLIPGANWIDALLPCLVSSVIMVTSGWALDRLSKPRPSTPAPSHNQFNNNWIEHLRPLLILLLILLGAATTLHYFTGVRTAGILISLVPAIALLWSLIQPAKLSIKQRFKQSARRAGRFMTVDLPIMRSELVLLSMAGFIGAVGTDLCMPFMLASNIDLTNMPPGLILLAVFWFIPIAGQLGMNPILAVSLFAPLLPAPLELGISPTALIVSITSGWALSGATSPFTASTLLTASFGQVGARHVGVCWNGPFALVCGLMQSVWILCIAAFF